MFECKCGLILKSSSGLKNHAKSCDGTGSKHSKFKQNQSKVWICDKCNFNIKNSRIKHHNACDGSGPRSKKKRNSRSAAAKLLWADSSYRLKTLDAQRSVKNSGIGLTENLENERRRKIKEKINKRYAEGWQPKCGRCIKYDYSSHVAGDIKVDGKWELAVCIYLDSLNVTWQRNTKRFTYKKPNNTNATYCPDFFVKDWNSYLEIKGYETELDKCKWRDFPINEKLIIWRKADLKERKILVS